MSAQVYLEVTKQDIGHSCSKISVVDNGNGKMAWENKNLVLLVFHTHLQILSHKLPTKLLPVDQVVLIQKMSSPWTNT